MIAQVAMDDGRLYRVEMVWDKTPGDVGHGWWLKSIEGQPRPARTEVAEIYRRALGLAQKAMRLADRGGHQ